MELQYLGRDDEGLGRKIQGKTEPLMERFSASIGFDWILYEYDLEGSKAHAEMLHKIGILNEKEERSSLMLSRR